MKKEKEIYASFAVPPQTAKFLASVLDKCLVNMEKALYLYNKKFLRKRQYIHKTYYNILLKCSILLLKILILLFSYCC